MLQTVDNELNNANNNNNSDRTNENDNNDQADNLLADISLSSVKNRIQNICQLDLGKQFSEFQAIFESNSGLKQHKSKWHSKYIETQQAINNFAELNERDLKNLGNFVQKVEDLDELKRIEPALNSLLDSLALEEEIIKASHIVASQSAIELNALYKNLLFDTSSLNELKEAILKQELKELPDWLLLLKEKETILKERKESKEESISTRRGVTIEPIKIET